VKRFMQGPGYYYLKPESTETEHRPIVLDEDFRVQGVVVDVLKKGSALLDSGGEQP